MPTEKFVSGASAKLLILLNLKPGLFSHHQSLAVYFIFSRVIIRPNDPALLGLRLGALQAKREHFIYASSIGIGRLRLWSFRVT